MKLKLKRFFVKGLALLLLLVTLHAFPALAVCTDPAGPGVDWSGCNKSAASLASVDLSNANLSGTNLTSAVLTGATLTNANLNNAVLTGVTGLTTLQLRSAANLQGVTFPLSNGLP